MWGSADYESVISFLKIQVQGQGVRVCVVNLHADIFEADLKLKVLQYGAEYFLENNYLFEPYEALSYRLHRWLTIDSLLKSPVITSRFAGRSSTTISMLRQVIELAFFSQNNVLLLGERGVGKEQIAHIIHDFDQRTAKSDMVTLDCSTLKKELSGSELFGHDRGAFTGADNNREGAVSLADKGTFFLDEITEMPVNLQSEFLRVVQEGSYKKLGSNIWRRSQFRLVAATNRNLIEKVNNGEF